MRLRFIAAIWMIAPILAACSQDESAPTDNVAVEESAPAATVDQSPTDRAPDKVNTPAAQVTGLPTVLQGRWGLTPADCDPARSDNKGLMVVSADTIRFYESQGTVQQAVAGGPNQVRATLAFTGEGMTWTTQDTFTLSADNATLTRRSVGRDGEFGPFEYRRCA